MEHQSPSCKFAGTDYCRFSEPMDPGGAEILKTFPPVGVRISQNLSPL